jgi:hypothetical protein
MTLTECPYFLGDFGLVWMDGRISIREIVDSNSSFIGLYSIVLKSWNVDINWYNCLALLAINRGDRLLATVL